jgi:RHS repeat-associated protein
MTDNNGVASTSVISTSASPTVPVSVSFTGDDNYSPVQDTASLKIERLTPVIQYTGKTTLAAGNSESLSAVLRDATNQRPIPNAVLRFEVGSTQVSSTTDANGVATANITLPPTQISEALPLKIIFAGDECRAATSFAVDVTAYLQTSFVIWGGNNERLRIGQKVNFWGHSWPNQVTSGDYKAHGDFKGYADTVNRSQLCQVNVRTTGAPPLNDSCWSTKPGQSFPPETIPTYIGVIVSTSIDKGGPRDFGNIAALAVVKVDAQPPYGPNPGKPGFGTIVAVITDGEGVFATQPMLSASQTQSTTALPAQTLSVVLTVSNNSTIPAANVSINESFNNLLPPAASAEVGALPAQGSQTRTFTAAIPTLQARRQDESSQAYQKRLRAAEGTVYSSFGVVRFQDATGRALSPVTASSSSILQLPQLAIGISATSCVSPGTTIPSLITLTNVGRAAAANATAVVTFADGTSTRVETTNLVPGAVFSSTVNWKVPVIASEGATESEADYISRLASFDGKLLKTTATVTWKDALGNDYGAVDQECSSVERVPILSQVASALPIMLPAQRVTLPTAVRNTGSGTALQARLRATNPDSSVFDASPFGLQAGSSSDVPTTLTAPAIEPKQTGETDAAYLARLRIDDNKPIDFALALEWTDAAGNTYGPLVGALRTTEVLPIVLVSLTAPETTESGDTITYQLTAENVGHAEAVGIELSVTLPDGRAQQVPLPVSALPPGDKQAAVVNFDVPDIQAEGQIEAHATLSWKDAAVNGYGPMPASAVTNVLNPNGPPQVNAGPDQRILLPASSIPLNGTASDDGKPFGSTLTVQWTKVSGPGTVTFTNASQAITTATFSAEGKYVLRLSATDSVLSASDEATIDVTRPPTGPIYSDTADLTDGEGVNLVPDEFNHLHLNNDATPFNFIWVAVSSKGTIVKLDTDNGQVLGEYFSSPAGQPKDPSRTTVDHNGNVWASNRAGNSVLRIGLAQNGQCVDRNGNGVIDTSRGQGDIRPWPNTSDVDTDGGVETAQDECIINYTRVRSTGTRHVSVNALNDVWVSGTGGEKFDLIDGTTGLIKRQEASVGFGGYGGLIDKKGVIWSARPLLRWDTALTLKGANGGNWKGYGHDSYGLCIDSQGNVWNTALGGNIIRKFAPDGTLTGTFDHGSSAAQGCVVDRNDHVWVAHSTNSRTVGHLKGDGTFIGNVTVGNGPTGVAADAKGKIWATNFGSRTVSRIDPDAGPMGADGTTRVGQVDLTTVDLKGNLYNYSDMTGSTLSGAPAGGTWTHVFDSGMERAEWGVAGWHGQVCGDGALLVKVSSSTDGSNFSAPVAVTNGAAFSVTAGRYLKVSVGFRRANSGESPFLYDFTVGTKGFSLPVVDNLPPAVDAGPDQTATMPNAANLVGNACDTGRVKGLAVSWEKVSGPGAVSFANAQVPATSATFTEAGEYVLRLTVADSELSSRDEMTVLVLPFNDAPAVSAGADQSVILPAAASLVGTVSDDALPTNSSVAIYWSKLSGPGDVSFTNPTAATTSASFSEAGEYVLRLTGDDSQLTQVDEIIVKVFPPNIAPAVNAGNDEAIRLPDKMTLNATVTDDGLPLGKTITFAWSKVSGPGTVSFANSKASDTTASFSAPGGYVLRLTASDTQLSASDELSILVQPANQPPSVNAGTDKSVTLPDAVQLDGTASDADELPEGRDLTVTWAKVSGPGVVTFAVPNNPATTASFSEAGTYVLRLSVSDSALSRSDDVSVTVAPSLVNLPPNVNAGADQTITLPAKASLAGVANDDRQPAGSTLTVARSKVSGPGNVTFANAAVVTTTATFSTAGAYVLRLTASDTAITTTDEVAVTVLPVNQPPVVKAGTDQIIAFPSSANLNGTATDDGQPAGGRLTVAWSKVSGPGEVSFANASTLSTTASFSSSGQYVLRLTASDSALSRTDDLNVTVNRSPTVDAGADQTIHLPNTASLRGTVTDDALPAGKIIVLAWTKISGPGTVSFSKPAAATTAATFGEAGTYVLRLTANDSLLQAADEVTITVNRPLPPPPSVSINSPADGAEITTRADVIGSVSHGSWKLEYSLGPDPAFPNSSTWTTIATGATPVENVVLGSFDPTLLLNGTYAIRLTSTDASGRSASATRNVVVAGQQKVGNFTISFEDLSVPVAGLPIQIIRTYDSRDKRAGDFGVGWRLHISNVRLEKSVELGRYWRENIVPGALPQYCLQATRPNIVTVTFPGEKVYKFQATTTKQCQAISPLEFARFGFTPMPGTKGSLVPEAPLDVMVEGSFPGPVELLNSADPQLRTYDPTVFRFTDEQGSVFIIDQKAGVRSVTDLNGNKLTINSDGITHSSGKGVAFTRNSAGRITRITDPEGNSMSYAYDANGDLSVFADRADGETKFTYNSTHGLLSITDPRGIQPVRNDYDDQGRLIRHTDAFGKTITYTHDLNARREAVTDRLGNTKIYEYDAKGLLVRATDPLGGSRSYTYDNRGNELSKTDPLNRTIRYTYDASDNKISQTDALGNITRFTYNARQQILSIAAHDGRVVTNTYDTRGNLRSATDPGGKVTAFTYAANGLLASSTDRAGNVTLYLYDKFGNRTKVTDPMGGVTAYTYDGNGNQLSQSEARTTSSGTKTLVTTFEYDKRNNLVKTTFPDSASLRAAYNSIDKRSATVDALGRQTAYDYDAMGNLIRTRYPDGTKDETAFDAEGRRLSSTDRGGRTTNYTYDVSGRLIKVTSLHGGTEIYTYDTAGQLLSTTDGNGNTTRNEYDAAGSRIKATDATGSSTMFSYDVRGNTHTVIDAKGNTTTFEYDANDRNHLTVYPNGASSKITYDAMSRPVVQVDPAGNTTNFVYDKRGRLTAVTDASGRVTTYAHDEAGNLVSHSDANGHLTTFDYDEMGRRVKRTLPLGMSETYAYDAASNMTSKRDFNGKVTTYAYDVMDRLVEKAPDPTLSQPKISYSYTPTGKRAQMVDASGTTTYAYDLHERLINKATPQGTLAYTYDGAGNLSSVRSANANGTSVNYSYDAANRLISVADQRLATGATSYSYDAVGNLTGIAYPNGVQSAYSYNSLNRLTDLTVSRIAPVASFTYALGPAGERLSVVESGGRRVNYTYDALDRLTSENITGSPLAATNGSVGYTYDSVGNRLTRTSTLSAVPSESHTYDANDRLTADAYDVSGNPLSAGGKTYAYDFENRLTRLNGGAVSVVYDGDGNCVSKTVGGVTTKYLVDDLNPTGYAQVLEETIAGNVQRVYTYGNDLIGQRQLLGDTWTVSFYGYDGHGSVRFLTDAAGSVTDTYDYDAFGNLIQRSGATPNNYLYAGERYDPDLGFTYLRARYLNQATGRFWTMDSYEGRLGEPLSLHKYLYAHASPVDRFDPSGHMTLLMQIVVGSLLLAFIAALASYIFYGQRMSSNPVSKENLKEVSRAIKIVEDAGRGRPQLEEIALKLRERYFNGNVRMGVVTIGVGHFASTNQQLDEIVVDDDFFKGTSSPYDTTERADILLHEGAHMIGTDSYGYAGTEKFAYTMEWKYKEAIGWTAEKYGEGRQPRPTALWNWFKSGLREHAPENLICDKTRGVPRDECLLDSAY